MSSSLERAKRHLADKLDEAEFSIGHLSDEAVRNLARDVFLIGCHDEAEILYYNDTTRYTAIISKTTGLPVEVFFDLQ